MITAEGYETRELSVLFGTLTPELQWIDGKGAAICLYSRKRPSTSVIDNTGYSFYAKEGEVDFDPVNDTATNKTAAEAIAEAKQFQGSSNSNGYEAHKVVLSSLQETNEDVAYSMSNYTFGRLLLNGGSESLTSGVVRCAPNKAYLDKQEFFEYRASEELRIMIGLDDIHFTVDPIEDAVYMLIDVDEVLPHDITVQSVAILAQAHLDRAIYDFVDIDISGSFHQRIRFNASENPDTEFINTALRLCPSIFTPAQLTSLNFPSENYKSKFWLYTFDAYVDFAVGGNPTINYNYPVGQAFFSIKPSWDVNTSSCQALPISSPTATITDNFEFGILTSPVAQSLVYDTVQPAGQVFSSPNIVDAGGNETIYMGLDDYSGNTSLIQQLQPLDGMYYFIEDIPGFQKQQGQTLRMQLKIKLHSA